MGLLKKVLYTGVGLVASTTERLQHAVDDIVEKSKLSEEEGKKVVDDVVKNAETQRPLLENRFRDFVGTTLERFNLPQAEAFANLEKRIKSLEVKVSLLAQELERQRRSSDEGTSRPDLEIRQGFNK
jgi:polyhydroxyalkanoate synthesis regulator phasin